jgi:hypothetical protein
VRVSYPFGLVAVLSGIGRRAGLIPRWALGLRHFIFLRVLRAHARGKVQSYLTHNRAKVRSTHTRVKQRNASFRLANDSSSTLQGKNIDFFPLSGMIHARVKFASSDKRSPDILSARENRERRLRSLSHNRCTGKRKDGNKTMRRTKPGFNNRTGIQTK